jgi:hypothetical protein
MQAAARSASMHGQNEVKYAPEPGIRGILPCPQPGCLAEVLRPQQGQPPPCRGRESAACGCMSAAPSAAAAHQAARMLLMLA